jgi:hypothetical protein
MSIIEELRAIVRNIFKGEIIMEDKINNDKIHDEIIEDIEDIVEEVVEKEDNNNSGDAPRGRCRRN